MSLTQPAPGRRDPAGRRRAILDAATELIIEHGVAALTHRAIATRAGVSLGSTTQYFSSLDELREAALQQLADEIDESLSELEQRITVPGTLPEQIAADMTDFLHDRRAVHADIALMTTGTTDPRLRELALRWDERLIEILAPRIGRERATAVAVYLDGATMHAGLNERPLDPAHITAVIRALLAMPESAEPHARPERN